MFPGPFCKLSLAIIQLTLIAAFVQCSWHGLDCYFKIKGEKTVSQKSGHFGALAGLLNPQQHDREVTEEFNITAFHKNRWRNCEAGARSGEAHSLL